MGLGPALRMAEHQLMKTFRQLASLSDEETAQVHSSLGSLEAPISSEKIRTLASTLSQKLPKYNDDEWNAIVGLILQLVRDPDYISTFVGLFNVEEEVLQRIDAVVKPISSNHPVARAIQIDRFIERGPRLRSFTWFCDLRTMFSERKDPKPDPGSHEPHEETTVPISIFRLRTDEVESPVYFQLTESEIDDLISKLERARKELRHVSSKTRR